MSTKGAGVVGSFEERGREWSKSSGFVSNGRLTWSAGLLAESSILVLVFKKLVWVVFLLLLFVRLFVFLVGSVVNSVVLNSKGATFPHVSFKGAPVVYVRQIQTQHCKRERLLQIKSVNWIQGSRIYHQTIKSSTGLIWGKNTEQRRTDCADSSGI